MLSQSYRLLTEIGAPFVSLFLRRRRAKGKEDPVRLAERFGHPSLPRPMGRLVWCHAASVGEASSLLLLIEKMHEAQPDIRFLLTTGTVTAAHTIGARLPSYAFHQYAPVDLRPCVARFLDHWRPLLAIRVESELWPNTLFALRRRRIPAVLLNARMSESSFRRWRWAKKLARELLSGFSLCLAQSESDAERFLALGAFPVKCVGNLKYASSPLPYDGQELMRLQASTESRPLWLMASTHAGEEALALDAHQALAARGANILTVIAPRHAVRGDEIASLIEERGLSCARRSKGESIHPQTQVYLADTMGEMGLFYALCPVAVIGGSFVPIGGHNPIEPAQSSAAIIFGPHMHNFDVIARDFIAAGAALQILGGADIAFAVKQLWEENALRLGLAENAKRFATEKRAVLDSLISELAAWIKKP